MVFATGAVAVVTVGAMMLGVLSDVIARVTFRAQGMVNPRLDLMKVSLSMVRNHPFRGVGLNRFENVMAHYDASGITNVIAHPVHNIYLLIGAETGLVSLVLFLMAGGILTFFSFSVLRRGEDEMVRITGIAGMLSCVGIAVSGLFDYALRQEPVLGMLVLVAALVVTQYTKLNEPEERPAVTRAGSAQDA
jgi:O-antigen ligase